MAWLSELIAVEHFLVMIPLLLGGRLDSFLYLHPTLRSADLFALWPPRRVSQVYYLLGKPGRSAGSASLECEVPC